LAWAQTINNYPSPGIGIKPFYYYSDSKSFIFGSQINQIIASKVCTKAPNEAMVCEYLKTALQTLHQAFKVLMILEMEIQEGVGNLQSLVEVSF